MNIGQAQKKRRQKHSLTNRLNYHVHRPGGKKTRGGAAAIYEKSERRFQGVSDVDGSLKWAGSRSRKGGETREGNKHCLRNFDERGSERRFKARRTCRSTTEKVAKGGVVLLRLKRGTVDFRRVKGDREKPTAHAGYGGTK